MGFEPMYSPPLMGFLMPDSDTQPITINPTVIGNHKIYCINLDLNQQNHG